MDDLDNCECTHECTIPKGVCHCGCGRKTNIAKVDNARLGHREGEPVKFLRGHAPNGRGDTHRIVDIDEDAREGFCTGCAKRVPLVRHKRDGWRCAIRQRSRARAWKASLPEGKSRADHRAWREANPDHLRAYRLKKYGITVEEYDTLLTAQGGGCAICGTTRGRADREVLYVDHCHATGAVRGLLCSNCNLVVGAIGDDPARAERIAEYLGGS